MEKGTNKLRCTSHIELELITGYRPHHTNILIKEGACCRTRKALILQEEAVRKVLKGPSNWSHSRRTSDGGFWEMLLLSRSYLLSPLLRSSVREVGKPLHSPLPCLVKECSAMEPNHATSYSIPITKVSGKSRQM